MSVFQKRINLRPYEYPEVTGFIDAINHSYWLISEWNFISDIQDFNTKLKKEEKLAVKNAMLAISQIEVAVKTFWAKLGDRFPKPEMNGVGVTFAESEQRHETAYSKLLEILGLGNEFSKLLENPIIQGRVDYLQKYLKGASDTNNENYTLSLALFSLFIENVSLFSQFAVIKSFNKHKNVLKDIDNVISATMQEENIHAAFGIYLTNIIKKENPEWFNEDFYEKIYRACKKAYEAESKIINWIFENGEVDFVPIESLNEFIKHRFNESVIAIGGKKVFDIDYNKLEKLKWLIEELYSLSNTDFFYKRPVSYSKFNSSVNEEDLF